MQRKQLYILIGLALTVTTANSVFGAARTLSPPCYHFHDYSNNVQGYPPDEVHGKNYTTPTGYNFTEGVETRTEPAHETLLDGLTSGEHTLESAESCYGT